MRAPLRTALMIATVLVAVPVMADAPNGSDPNRKAQYDAFLPATTTIHDVFTDLVWERFTPKTKRTFDIAQTNCSGTFSGRLPSVKELLTIVDEDPHEVYDSTLGKTIFKAVDRDAFGRYTYTDGSFWTSTPTGDPDKVWGINFADGTMVELDTTAATAYARCVR